MESIKKKNIINIFFTVLLLFIVYYIIQLTLPNKMLPYIITQYLVSYDLGFISRGFIGSLLSLMQWTDTMHIYFFITLSHVLLIGIVGWFVAKVINQTDSDYQLLVVILALFFCSNPGSITYLFTSENFGRLELFCIILMFVSIFMIMHNGKGIYLIPLLSVLSILIYHASIFMFLPVVFILLLHGAVTQRSKRLTIVLVLSIVLSCGAFLYMQFFGKIYGHNLEQTVAILQAKTDFEVDKNPIFTDYYMPLSGHQDFMHRRWPELLRQLPFIIVVFSPVIASMLYLTIHAFVKSNKKLKLMYLAIMVNALTFIPMFLLAVDYGRWYACLIISQFTLILSLIHLKDLHIIGALASLQKRCAENKLLPSILVMAYAIMPRFLHYNAFPLFYSWLRFIDAAYMIKSAVLGP